MDWKHEMLTALALLAGVVIGFAGGWAAFGLSDDVESGLTRAQAEQAVIRDQHEDLVHCQDAGGGEFTCLGFARQLSGPKEGELVQVSLVTVYERDGTVVTEDATP